jgi:hypothetical protein
MSKPITDFGSKTNGLQIIEPTMEATNTVGHRYGSELLEVTREDIQALLDGKAWGFPVNEGEYMHFVVLKEQK